MDKLKLQHSVRLSNTAFLASELPRWMSAITDVVPASLGLVKGIDSVKVGLGRNPSCLLLSTRREIAEGTTGCRAVVTPPREWAFDCWGDNMVSLRAKCQSWHFIPLLCSFRRAVCALDAFAGWMAYIHISCTGSRLLPLLSEAETVPYSTRWITFQECWHYLI